jgi:hypothetical protein
MLDRFLRLTWTKVLLIIAAWVLCVVTHNAIYALFREYFGPNGDEPFFFLLAVVVIPLYVGVAVLYTVTRLVRQRNASGNEKA